MFDASLYIRMSSLPEAPAAIDWSYYRSAVAKAGMVDEFEKKVCILHFALFFLKVRNIMCYVLKVKLSLEVTLPENVNTYSGVQTND